VKIVICSDGMPASDNAVRIGALLAGPCRAATALLGITEKVGDEKPLRDALEKEAQTLSAAGALPEIVVRAGEPIRQIVDQTTNEKYDFVVIGAQRKGSGGLYWRSEKTYEVIKAIAPPVLVAMGEVTQLKRLLVCTGGKHFIEDAVRLTGQLAACVGASVTLLHVMAEPPAIYADLVRLEEDVDALLQSGSELGLNLRAQKESLEKLGVSATVRIRHGFVLDQVFEELRDGEHDLVVTGSSRTRGPWRHYIMGDLTRSILNRADCPVLVARVGEIGTTSRGLFGSLKRIFLAQ
jgi:nucleotide-binding universal stress UspA family protein